MADKRVKRHHIIWKKNWHTGLSLMDSDSLVNDLETWKRFGIHTFGPFVEETR